MNESLFAAFGFHGSGPVTVLRELALMWIKAMGPLIDVVRPLWERLVTFLSQLYDQLSEQFEQDQDRASWGRPELGWDS